MKQEVQMRKDAPRCQRNPRRDLYFDTHCITDGRKSTPRPIVMPEDRRYKNTGLLASAALVAVMLPVVLYACLVNGCLL